MGESIPSTQILADMYQKTSEKDTYQVQPMSSFAYYYSFKLACGREEWLGQLEIIGQRSISSEPTVTAAEWEVASCPKVSSGSWI